MMTRKNAPKNMPAPKNKGALKGMAGGEKQAKIPLKKGMTKKLKGMC